MFATMTNISLGVWDLDFFLDVVCVAVKRRPRDHFTEKPGKEQHYTENDSDKSQIEQWLIGDISEMHALCLMHEFGDDK